MFGKHGRLPVVKLMNSVAVSVLCVSAGAHGIINVCDALGNLHTLITASSVAKRVGHIMKTVPACSNRKVYLFIVLNKESGYSFGNLICFERNMQGAEFV